QKVIETVDKDKSEYSKMKEEVNKAVNVINEIADAIQSQEDIGRYGSLFYSCTSLAGSGLLLAGALAPFTAGLSFAVTAGGAALGASSAVIDLIHENVRDYLIDSKLHEATEIFEYIYKRWGQFNPGTSHSFSRNPCSFFRFERIPESISASFIAYMQYKNFQKSSVSKEKTDTAFQKGEGSFQKSSVSEEKTDTAFQKGEGNFQKSSVSEKKTDTAFQKGEGASNQNMKINQAYSAVKDAIMDIRKIIQTWKMISYGTVSEKSQYLKEKAETLKTEMETMFN
ncbi:hypothetical protein FSP39_016536, partial [Pinctada imbricata]